MGVVYLMFFFNDTAATEIYTLSLHDALPISLADAQAALAAHDHAVGGRAPQPRESALGLYARHDRVEGLAHALDRESTRLNSSHANISYAVFCLEKNRKWQWEMQSPIPLFAV